jgi:hypothetical protein
MDLSTVPMMAACRADILEEVAQQGEAMARMESNVERLERRFQDVLHDRELLQPQASSDNPPRAGLFFADLACSVRTG